MNEGSPSPPDPSELGAAPSGCEEIVDSLSECTPLEGLCRPDICGSWTCCFVEDNEWKQLITDCFDGCAN